MGAKFYRGSDKGKKIRKRFSQTRSWFRTLKWVSYHAHPLMIVGHPFKGGWVMPQGYLLHPDMKMFSISTPFLFAPANPLKVPGAAMENQMMPSFSKFFQSYFGGSTYHVGNPNCSKMMEGMKRCFENNTATAHSSCAYYTEGFKRMACSKQ